MPVTQWDPRRSVMRWIYAERRLALPISPQHLAYMQTMLALRPEDVPDDECDAAVLEHGLGCYLSPSDCGSPGVWPGLSFDRLRDQFCIHEIQARRTGTWPEAASKEQSDFDRAYHPRITARREGRDPGIFLAFTHAPRRYSSKDLQAGPGEDDAPF